MSMLRCLVLIALAAGASARAEITVERIFGKEIPTGPYKHPACFDELANGDLYLVYYGGAGEYAEHTAVFGSRLLKGTRKWTRPERIASNPLYSLGNGVIWQAPDDWVWLFHVTRYAETWSSSRISAKISRDFAKTWSDDFPVTFELGTMVRGHPIVLSDGAYLLPVYHETGNDPERLAPDSSSFFIRFDPKTRQWRESTRIRSRIGNIQPAPVEVSPGHLIAFCRRGGGYEPTRDGYLVRSESHDGGLTWSEGVDSEFPNPNAAVDFIKLRNGHLLLVYNNSMNDRTPLTAAISTDGGKTFPRRRDIVKGPGDFGYPTAIQSRDGRIQVMFTSDERSVIRRAVFDEADIR